MDQRNPGSLLTVPVDKAAWPLMEMRHELGRLAMTARDRRELMTAIHVEVIGLLERLPYTVPAPVCDAFVDALHVAIEELGREDDPFEYDDFYSARYEGCGA